MTAISVTRLGSKIGATIDASGSVATSTQQSPTRSIKRC